MRHFISFRLVSLILVALIGAFLVQKNLRPVQGMLSLATATNVWLAPEKSPASGDFWLTGLPAFGQLNWLLPTDAGITGATAELEIRSDLAGNANALLKISADGRLLEAVALSPGRNEQTVAIQLPDDLLTRRRLALSLRLEGDSGPGPCTADRDQAASIRIRTGANMMVTLDGPLISTGDQWAMIAPDLRLRTGSSPQQRADSLNFALGMMRSGRNIRLSDENASQAAVSIRQHQRLPLLSLPGGDLALSRRYAAAFARSADPFWWTNEPGLTPAAPDRAQSVSTWPVPAEATGLSLKAQRKAQITWRGSFLISDLKGPYVPSRLSLKLRATGLAGQGQLALMLNEQLLDSSVVNNGENDITFTLPGDAFALNNSLRLDFTDLSSRHCAPSAAAVQLLPDSELFRPQVLPRRDDLDLIALLKRMETAALDIPPALNAGDLQRQLPLLRSVLPASLTLAALSDARLSPVVISPLTSETADRWEADKASAAHWLLLPEEAAQPAGTSPVQRLNARPADSIRRFCRPYCTVITLRHSDLTRPGGKPRPQPMKP